MAKAINICERIDRIPYQPDITRLERRRQLPVLVKAAGLARKL